MSRGKKRWRLRIPARFSATGREQHLYYDSRREAEADAVYLRSKHGQGELLRADTLGPEAVRQARQAMALLADAGSPMSLVEAVEVALAHERALGRGVTVEVLLEQYAAAVADARRWSDKYRGSWRLYSARMVQDLGERHIVDVTAQVLRDWLAVRCNTPSLHNGAMGVLSPAWTWAVQQDMLDSNPWCKVAKRKERQREGVDVYTPEEAARVLHEAGLRGVLVPWAVLLYAGIRPKELTRMTWEDVKRQPDGSMLLHVRPSVAKTRSVRLVRVREPLHSVLLRALPAEGPLCPPSWDRLAKLVRSAAGVKGRPDAPRHSFASYLLGLGTALAEVESDMGHSKGSDMLYKHYRAAVTPEDSRKFWDWRP